MAAFLTGKNFSAAVKVYPAVSAVSFVAPGQKKNESYKFLINAQSAASTI